MTLSRLRLAQAVLLTIVGAGMTACGVILWLGWRSLPIEWMVGTRHLLMTPLLLLVGLLFLAAGISQLLKIRREFR